jgi:hypothetical protein
VASSQSLHRNALQYQFYDLFGYTYIFVTCVTGRVYRRTYVQRCQKSVFKISRRQHAASLGRDGAGKQTCNRRDKAQAYRFVTRMTDAWPLREINIRKQRTRLTEKKHSEYTHSSRQRSDACDIHRSCCHQTASESDTLIRRCAVDSFGTSGTVRLEIDRPECRQACRQTY